MARKNLCDQCPEPGACCYYSAPVHGKEIKVDMHCNHLKNGKCTIYKLRYLVPDCLSVEQSIAKGTLPKWCPYVKDDPAYQARTDTRLYNFAIVEWSP